MNVTMVIGLINGVTKKLTLANAGHHAHPLLVRGGTIEPLVSKGMPLGMMASISYREIEFQLQSGDVLVFMTDGIIEAKDSDGREYQFQPCLKTQLRCFRFPVADMKPVSESCQMLKGAVLRDLTNHEN